MQIESYNYDKLKKYIEEKDWDSFDSLVNEINLDSSVKGNDLRNLWFHNIVGFGYYRANKLLMALPFLSGFLNMCKNDSKMKAYCQKFELEIPTNKEIQNIQELQSEVESKIRVEYEGVITEAQIDEMKTLYGLSDSKKGCFIATAIYGSEFSNEVFLLKRVRDEILLTSKPGRIFVSFYYHISPPIARIIRNNSFLKITFKKYLIIPVSKYFVKKLD